MQNMRAELHVKYCEENKIPVATIVKPPEVQKLPSEDEARSALDALRLNGKKGPGIKLYNRSNIKPMSKSNVLLQDTTTSLVPEITPISSLQSETIASSIAIGEVIKPTEVTNSDYSLHPEIDVSKLRVKRVCGDGHCAFRAIAQGLHDGMLDEASELKLAIDLRMKVCNRLIDRAQDEMTGTGLTVEQVVLMKDTNYASFADYVSAMSKSDHAGETEFWLLSELLKANIAVFYDNDKTGKREHLITYGNETTPPICLFWQRGNYSDLGNHYDLLI